MSKVMLVNVTHVEESRVAILEDGVLAQYEIETLNQANIKGNIHNAVVDNVHPSLEAAFLRISPDLKGFLPLDEVNFRLLPSRGEGRGRGRIGQHLHPGQKLMVQVVREPFAGKPPTVTTYFSLPGRYLVLLPGIDSAGVSRKIEDSSQRERLKHLVEELSPPEGFGLIVRTAGLGQSKVELQRDLRYLLRLWESIQRASRATEFPGRVYRERDLVIRTMRDYFTPDIGEVWIDSPETHERALEFVRDVMPGKAKIVKLYTGDRPLFSKFNLEEQIETIYKRRVPLKSGGEIVIDGTEALTAIDVNSARSSRQGDAEENATQTNVEAAAEIARQLRLRDLGGLVVVDFIDMAAARNQKRVEKAMRDAMKTDRAKYDVTRISKLGLLEIARQRIKGEKMRVSYATCPACEGYGLIKNVEAAALAGLRKIQTRCGRGDFGRLRVALPPDVATWILNNKREDLVALERRNTIRISVEPKASLLRHEAEFETSPREKVEEPPALITGDRPAPPLPPDLKDLAEPETPATAEEVPATADGPGAEDGAGSGPDRRRRRRRRRRGRGGGASAESTGAPPAGTPVGPEVDEPSPSFEVASETGASAESFPVAGVLPAGEAAEPAGGFSQDGDTDGSARRRRRRRRRRRGKAGAGPSIADGQEAAENVETGRRHPPDGVAPAETSEETGVPRHIRSEELMPAATGGLPGESRGSGSRGRHHRRRRRVGAGEAGVAADRPRSAPGAHRRTLGREGGGGGGEDGS